MSDEEFGKNTIRWIHGACIAALMVAQVVVAAVSSTASADTNRDIFFAYQIAHGNEFPLIGPQINGMAHLGPIWFYILAIAAMLVRNAAAVTGLMALIGSLQFPFAYVLGRRFGSSLLGIAFVLALALPGVMAVSMVSLTHTIAIIPCIFLTVFATLAYREDPDWKRALWLGVAGALALNAHPTTLLLLGILTLLALAKSPTRWHWLLHAAVVALPITLSFAPMIYAQYVAGFADATNALAYAHGGISLQRALNFPWLLSAILFNAPMYLCNFWLDTSTVLTDCLMGVYLGVLLIAAVGLIVRWMRTPSDRKTIAFLIGIACAQAAFVCAIRGDMPAWMAYAEWPLLAALIAVGLSTMCERGNLLRTIIFLGLIVTTLWTAMIWSRTSVGSITITDMKPEPGKLPFLGDIRNYSNERYTYRLPRVPFRQDYALGAPLCSPTTLYGHYAYLIDISYGVGPLASCGDRDQIVLGGPETSDHNAIVGLRKEAWRALGFSPPQQMGVLGIVRPASVWTNSEPLQLVSPLFSTWPHSFTAGERHFTIEGDATRNQIVLIAQRAHRFVSFKVGRATANNLEVTPSYTDEITFAFRTLENVGTDNVHWRIEVEGAPEYIDALTIDMASPENAKL